MEHTVPKHLPNTFGAKQDVLLSHYSNWSIGGPADYFIEPTSIEDLRTIIGFCIDNETPYIVIGKGTNLLFDDSGYRGLVIRLGPKLSRFKFVGDATVEVECGHWVPWLALRVARAGYSGIEHAIGIPATIGGLIFMNGGSLRNSISQNVDSVTVLTPNGTIKTLENADCNFRYRSSAFQKTNDIVLSSIIRFNQRAEYSSMRKEMLKILRSRRSKFPRKSASCGSTFISAEELYDKFGPPGKIIEDLGFKGYRSGNIEVSKLHANFIVNTGGGKSSDVLFIVDKIKFAAFEKLGVYLNCEFKYVHPIAGIKSIDSDKCIQRGHHG